MINQFRHAERQIEKLKKNMHEDRNTREPNKTKEGIRVYLNFDRGSAEEQKTILLAIVPFKKNWVYKK